MILISYDISNNKLRTRFSRYLSRFGHRIQYSLYEIDLGPQTVEAIKTELDSRWMKCFGEEDSVIIMKLSKWCEVERFGYAKHDEEVVVIV